MKDEHKQRWRFHASQTPTQAAWEQNEGVAGAVRPQAQAQARVHTCARARTHTHAHTVTKALCRPSKRGHSPGARVDFSDRAVALICHYDIAINVYSESVGAAELGVASHAVVKPLCPRCTRQSRDGAGPRMDLPDAVVERISDVDVPREVNRDTNRLAELGRGVGAILVSPRPVPTHTGAGDGSIMIRVHTDLADPVVFRICHIHVAMLVHSHPLRPKEPGCSARTVRPPARAAPRQCHYRYHASRCFRNIQAWDLQRVGFGRAGAARACALRRGRAHSGINAPLPAYSAAPPSLIPSSKPRHCRNTEYKLQVVQQ